MTRLLSSVKRRLLWVVIVAAWFLCPLPNPSPTKTVNEEHQGPPSSVVVDVPFVCDHTSDEMTLDALCHLTGGRVEIELLDSAGKPLAGPFALTEDKNDNETFVTDDGFPQGQTYRLRCTKRELAGRYRVSISQPWPITVAHRYLADLAILGVGLIVTAVLGLFDIGGNSMRRWCGGIAWGLFLATF
jgi:hypothetical protein